MVTELLIVKVAAFEFIFPGVQVPVNTTRYLLSFIEVVTPVSVRSLLVAAGIAVQLAPASVLICHCLVKPVPVATLVNVTLLPVHAILLVG